jgi:uncharacterized protein (DUF952 family)
MTPPPDQTVFHICTRAEADAARTAGEYRAVSLEREGFIHLSRAHQVWPTARAYFAGVAGLVLLVVDPTKLTAPLVYEAPAPLPSATPKTEDPATTTERYPHCYGPIAMEAVVEVIELSCFDGARPRAAITSAPENHAL